jgi:hypothetical protein
MNRNDFDRRAMLYASLATGGHLPPEMDGSPEVLAQRIRDRIADKGPRPS